MTFACALVLAFLTCWIFLPPFHAVLVPLAVGAPEVSPVLSVAAGVKSVGLEIPWAEHAFDAIPNGPSAQIALYYTERFLARTLNP